MGAQDKVYLQRKENTGMGVTLFHTINFNKKINAKPGNDDMHWLIHELTHVVKIEKTGSQYIEEAIAAQAGAGYSYTAADLKNKNLKDFNQEQQGDVIAKKNWKFENINNVATYKLEVNASDF